VLQVPCMETPTFKPRARFCGNVEWLCAYCGTINKHRLAYSLSLVECRGRNCSHRYDIGLIFHVRTRQSSGGKQSVVIQNYIVPSPDEAFPVVQLEEARRDGEVHRIVEL